ncbi:hypothetical protein Acsp04_64610 [Actinomadura sp. NBRC 104425]|nr:hypothetical protein Acsp04_64610 [Actinomadura sp. NBRC 104425]
MRQVQHEPVLGDALHPGADVGDDLAGGEQPVVADAQRTEHAAGGLLGLGGGTLHIGGARDRPRINRLRINRLRINRPRINRPRINRFRIGRVGGAGLGRLGG